MITKVRSETAIRPPVKSNRFAVAVVSLVLLFGGSLASFGTLIFSENMGSPSGTTAIGANAFQNSGTLTYAGSGDVRNTIVSSGYTGASGGGNVFLTDNGAANFIIGSINTLGYSSLSLSFGAFKSTTASSMSALILSYSINGGVSYSPLAIPAQPTGGGTSNWRLISGLSLPSNAAGISDLRLQWTNTDPLGSPVIQFRLDDIKLEGSETIIAVVPEPSTYLAALMLVLPFGVHGVRYLRNRKRA